MNRQGFIEVNLSRMSIADETAPYHAVGTSLKKADSRSQRWRSTAPPQGVTRPALAKIFHERLSIRAEGRVGPAPVLEIIRHVLPPSFPLGHDKNFGEIAPNQLAVRPGYQGLSVHLSFFLDPSP